MGLAGFKVLSALCLLSLCCGKVPLLPAAPELQMRSSTQQIQSKAGHKVNFIGNIVQFNLCFITYYGIVNTNIYIHKYSILVI